jgi:hypothetical protein
MYSRYVGDGHYCFADTIAMVVGSGDQRSSTIEVLSGSPFGMCIVSDLPYFVPGGWSPEVGISQSLDLLGWAGERIYGSPEAAVSRIRQASCARPVLAGPFEMGLLPYHPGLGQPIGVDHYLAVVGTEGDTVIVHDPRGYPFAAVPLDLMLAAWRTDSLNVPVESFALRADFRRVRDFDLTEALHSCLRTASQRFDAAQSRAAVGRLGEIIEDGVTTAQWFHLVDYMVSVSARRLCDASALLGGIGCAGVAGVLDRQARLVGSLQYPLVKKDKKTALAVLQDLAPTYDQLHDEMIRAIRNPE